jgi:predicted transcriptional regulator
MKPSTQHINKDIENILISLRSVYAKGIYDGTKRVELRRRSVGVSPGTVVWLYEKVPVGSITGNAKVKAVHTASPRSLWRDFGAVSGLSKSEFFSYFEGVSEGCVLVLDAAARLETPLPLTRIRQVMRNFQPPQFFARMGSVHPVLAELKT